MASSSSKHSRSLLGTFIDYICHPTYGSPATQPKHRRTALKQVLRLYGIMVFLLIPIMMTINTLSPHLPSNKHAVSEFAQSVSPSLFLLTTVIVGPLLEEIVFRLPLRYTPTNLAWGVALSGLFITALSSEAQQMILLFGGALTYIVLTKCVKRMAMIQWYAKYFRWIFYGVALIFGAIHMTNYEPQVWPYAPLLVCPQILLGLFFGFIRLEYGFRWAVFSHSFHNFCFSVPLLLSQLNTKISSDPQSATWGNEAVTRLTYLFILIGLLLCFQSNIRLIQDWRTEQS